MRDWLTSGLLQAAENPPEDFEGFVLGRGLPQNLFEEMRIGLWSKQPSKAPDATYAERNGAFGEKREGWMSIPIWSPRLKIIGVIYRLWGGPKGFLDYMLPDAKMTAAFIGLTPSALQRIWGGGDVWLVEGLFDMTLGHVIPARDAVLACGTANLTRHQLNFLRRFLSRSAMVHVVYDEDKTGRDHAAGYLDQSTGRQIPGVCDRLSRAGIKCRDVRYRGGKDPGAIWEAGGKSLLSSTFNLRESLD